MECGRHNLVSANPGSSEQEVVRRVGVYDINTSLQISSLKLGIGDGSFPKDDYSPCWSQI